MYDTELRELEPLIAWVERTLQHGRPDLFEDLMQTGRLAALNALSTYQEDKAASLQTWVVRYVRRDMVRLLEQENRVFDDVERLLTEEPSIEQLLDEEFQHQMEVYSDVERLLDRLTEIERFVVVEHLYNDKSFAEIAQIKGVSKQAVHQIYTDAVAFLRAIFT